MQAACGYQISLCQRDTSYSLVTPLRAVAPPFCVHAMSQDGESRARWVAPAPTDALTYSCVMDSRSDSPLNEDQCVLIIDLEATCDEGDRLPPDEMEIIEIGAVWANADGHVIDTFQALVRPVVHPQLTAFCMQLTGIQQSDVDDAEPFPIAASKLASFAQGFHPQSTVWGSWGQFDANQLARECERHGVQHPLIGFEHVNLKRRFAKGRKIKEVGTARALQMVGYSLDGTHHRGLDDAKNIAKLLRHIPSKSLEEVLLPSKH